MSRGRLKVKRSRAAYYSVGQKPAPREWYLKRVGWFGKFTTLTLVVAFFGFAWGLRWSLFASYNVAYSVTTTPKVDTSTATKAAVPELATGIANIQPVLDKWGKDHAGQHWSVSVKSLDGAPFSASLNGDDTYSIDGSYRLFLTLPLFAQMTLEKQQQTMVTANGNRQVVSKCVDLMIRISDNNCGVAVSKYVNVSRANALFKQDGFAHTSFVGSATKLKTTANDTAQFMISLSGSMFDQSSQALVMNALNKQVFRTGIPAACPGCQEADYSGFSGGSVYDTAIVNYSHGKYVIAIFSENGTGFEDISKLAGQIQQRVLDATK